eukprot:15434640-Alexandrium_andersonii.AAC.1
MGPSPWSWQNYVPSAAGPQNAQQLGRIHNNSRQGPWAVARCDFWPERAFPERPLGRTPAHL